MDMIDSMPRKFFYINPRRGAGMDFVQYRPAGFAVSNIPNTRLRGF